MILKNILVNQLQIIFFIEKKQLKHISFIWYSELWLFFSKSIYGCSDNCILQSDPLWFKNH